MLALSLSHQYAVDFASQSIFDKFLRYNESEVYSLGEKIGKNEK